MVRLGVIGAGRIGQIHGRNAASTTGAALVAVADALPEAARTLADAVGAAVRTVDDILDAGDVDAVVICSPTDTHADLVERAARAGKAVFCEKPIDLSSERVARTLEVVARAGTPLMVGFNRRFDPHLGALRARVAAGEVGAIEIVTILSRDPGPPPLSYVERSGGLFRDMTIHDLDMARFLVGEEFVAVQAFGSSLVDPAIGRLGDVDTAVVQMRTESGTLCQISNSRRATYGYDQRVEVHGAKGLLRVGNVHETAVEVAGAEGFRADPAQNFFLERYAEAYRREIAAFVDGLAAGRSPVPSGIDGLRAQRLADAATASVATGVSVRVVAD